MEEVMIHGIGISGTGAHIEQSRLDALANNLANIETPGFKRDLLSFMQRPMASTEAENLDPWTKTDPLFDLQGAGVQLRDMFVDSKQGALRETGNNLDLALNGPGYFVVQHIDRGQAYTRAGNFTLAPNGDIVTRDGMAHLLDSRGRRLNMNELAASFGASGSSLGIAPDGAISVLGANGGAEDTGRSLMLHVLAGADEAKLEKLGNTLIAPREGEAVKPLVAHNTEIKQGRVELSSSDPVLLMSEMVDVNRAFEANLRMLRIQDQTLSTLIQRVGEVPFN
jgi:flagellar basal-body rod protein FlgG